MIIRFQADADFNQNIVTGVLRREPRVDFQTALTAGLEGLQDREVLELAAKEGRFSCLMIAELCPYTSLSVSQLKQAQGL
jgi:hypothetical protein